MSTITTTATAEDLDFDPFAAGAIERVIATTEAQREVWLADRLAPQASLAYNESVSLVLRGPLDADALRRAIEQTVARHESLRATISADGMQLLIDEPAPRELPLRDLAGLDEAARQAALAQARAEAVETRFDLEQGPLLRAVLLRCAPDLHELLLTAHHIVCDGWSWGQVIEDIGLLYAQGVGGDGSGLAPAPARYEDYVQRERIEAQGPEMEAHTRFWVERFAGGEAPVVDLPADRPRPATRGFDSRRVDVLVDAALVQQVRQRGAASGASLFATLFGAFAGTVHRLTQQDDLVIGVSAAGQSAHDMPTLVGHCVNLLPIRIAVDQGMAMQALVRQSGTTLLDAFEHQTLTYGTLLRKLQLQRDPSRPTLVSVVFNLDREAAVPAGAFPGLAVDIVANPRHFENFELFLNCTPTAQGLRLECQYNTGLFDEASVLRWLALFRAGLERFAADPALTVAQAFAPGEADRALLAAFNRRAEGAPREELLHVCFERQAAAQPQAPALRLDGRTVSYGELNAQANRIAHRLLALGLRPDSLVGLCAERSVEMLAALLGILKAGAAYVPMDPAYPADRLAHMLRDSAPAALLTQSHLAARVPPGDAPVILLDDATLAAQPAHDPDPAALGLTPAHLAYVIYTSGSTGVPKGVLVEHRQVSRLFGATQPWFHFGAQDVWTLFHSFAFDFSVWEIWGALLHGGQLVIVPQLTTRDPQAFHQLLCDEGVTVLNQTPSAFRQLMAAQAEAGPGARHRLRTVVFGGEKLEPSMLRPWYQRAANQATQLVNMYGITETTVHVTYRPLSAQDAERIGTSPIGERIPDLTIHVLDAQRRPVPIGVVGELYVGGAGVARGYLNRPELNAERFIPDPFSGEAGARLYKTGDLGRYLNDGSLEYLGRNDFQVKVRGFRIELGEIEARLAACAGVGEAAVIAREDVPGDLRLVGYVSAQGGATLSPAELRQALGASLPDYMVPAAIVVLPKLPLNTSGKLDRKALPAPDLHAILGGAGARVRALPASELERRVLGLMEQVLSLPGLSMEDDFFALGGHSLLAARLTAMLGREFDMKLSLATLFESPTAARLARAIEALRAGGQATALERIAQRADQRSAPLTPQQERIRFIETMYPGRAVYNGPSAHRFTGALDIARFHEALRAIVRRQATLRTRVGTDPNTGAPVQEVLAELDPALEVVDLRALPADEREARLQALMQAGADAPFDIHQGPLFRFALYRLTDEEHAFLFVPHHLIWDGWSFDLFQAELSETYRALAAGRAPELPALAVSYGDYAAWFAQWLESPECARQLAFWKQRFAQAPRPAPLPTDLPRRAGMTGAGGNLWVRVDQPLAERLREAARGHDVTLSMLCLGVYVLMMASLSPNGSIVVATPVRGREQPGLEPVMGFFNNVLPLPFTLDRSLDLGAFVQQLKRELVAAMDHQQVPFERVATEPEFAERMQGAGLYQALFSFQDARARPADIGGLGHRQIHLRQQAATDDLGLWLMDKPNGLEGAINYNADIYLPETGEALCQRYMELLAAVAADPRAPLAALLDAPASRAAAHLRALAERSAEAPAAAEAAPAQAAQAAALLQPEQAELAQVWASVIGIDVNEIRPSDTFFDLGGDSLMAMRVIQQAEAAMGLRIEPRRYVFETLAQLAATPRTAVPAAAAAVAAPGAAKRGLLSRLFAGRGQ
ncbi:non-ribosomal peptide synthetase [Xenophilus azovorans]|uniref:non-ribosomal peptide synthetase n=2 Tax=Comamonadaceae TaxID=80864 RepID=UPI00069057C4|nr:non-ribosomal peptide synthetase [Xenophilus azovorans]